MRVINRRAALESHRNREPVLDRWYKDNFDDLVSMTQQIKKSNNRSLYPFLQRLLVANRLAGVIPDKPSRDEIAA